MIETDGEIELGKSVLPVLHDDDDDDDDDNEDFKQFNLASVQLFIYTQLNVKTVLFQTIQFSMSKI